MKDERESMNTINRFADGELELRLRAYAEACLSPDRWASIRMRGAVIEHGRSMPAFAAPAAPPTSRSWRLALRPLVAMALVGVLALCAGATAVFAASPGGPLYGVRLWIEAATLPAAADARLDAQVQQTGSRVDEAVGAAGQGNGAAVSAALAAYRAEVNALLAAAGDDLTTLARLRAELRHHIAALEALSVSNPEAAEAIQAAITESQKALDKIAAKTQGHGRPTQQPGRP